MGSKFEKNIGNILQNIGDLERMSTKLTLGKIGPRELNQMAQSIHEVEKIKEELTDRKVFRTFPFEIKDILACAKQINSTTHLQTCYGLNLKRKYPGTKFSSWHSSVDHVVHVGSCCCV